MDVDDKGIPMGHDIEGSREQTVARVARYFVTEVHLPDAEANSRAEEVVGLMGLRWLRGLASELIHRWWLFLLRGLLAIVFGVLALIQPIAALMALALVFGVWAFVDGVTALSLGLGRRHSWPLVIAGLIGIAAGAFTFFRPGITLIALYAAFAGWSIARGVLEIAAAIELRREIEHEFWLVLGGIASVLFGVLLIVLPAAGVLAVAWLIGIYALIFGVIMIVLSLRLRGLRERAPLIRPSLPIGGPAQQPV